jgi:hypothetical protein
LEAGDFRLYDIESKTAKGLDTVTKAIYDSDVEITEPVHIAAAWRTYTGREIDLVARMKFELTRLGAESVPFVVMGAGAHCAENHPIPNDSRLRAGDCLFVFSVGGGDAEREVSVNLVRAMQPWPTASTS